jgi:hypothetical protein
MGMTSRRVKRGKRSKKYLHHGCRKTSRRRYTRIQRIQRGGKMHSVCKSTGFFKKSGITITYDDETQMYTIGSKPYAQLSDEKYGNALIKLKEMFQLVPMNDAGYINLNQSQFDQFAELYCKNKSTDKQCEFITGFRPPAAAAAPAPASDERVSIKDAIKLIRTTDVGGRLGLNVQFFGKPHILLVDKPLEIDVPPNPNSRQNPITKLIFRVNGDNINVEFVLKKDVFSYCAMARYDDPSFIDINDLNFGIPHIRKTIFFGNQLKTEIISNNEVSIGDQIIPIMDKIQKYANECATEPDTMELGGDYYKDNVRSDHIPDMVKEDILKLFRPSSLSSRMSKLSIGKG